MAGFVPPPGDQTENLVAWCPWCQIKLTDIPNYSSLLVWHFTLSSKCQFLRDVSLYGAEGGSQYSLLVRDHRGEDQVDNEALPSLVTLSSRADTALTAQGEPTPEALRQAYKSKKSLR